MTMPVIICDLGEQRSGLPKLLTNQGCAVEFERLKVGDYQLSAALAVERKASADFAESIRSGRLLEQLQQLAAQYQRAALLIEGAAWEGDRGLKTPMLARVYQWISMHPNVSCFPSPSTAYSARILAGVARAEQFEREAVPTVVPAAITTARSGLDLVRALPGVGVANAKKLIDEFGSLHGVVLADERALCAAIGPVRGRKVYALVRGETP